MLTNILPKRFPDTYRSGITRAWTLLCSISTSGYISSFNMRPCPYEPCPVANRSTDCGTETAHGFVSPLYQAFRPMTVIFCVAGILPKYCGRKLSGTWILKIAYSVFVIGFENWPLDCFGRLWTQRYFRCWFVDEDADDQLGLTMPDALYILPALKAFGILHGMDKASFSSFMGHKMYE